MMRANRATSQPSASDVIRTLAQLFDQDAAVKFAYLFGSVARGQAGPLSDLDIAVYHDPPLGDPRPLITTIVGSLATEDVDLVSMERAGPLLRHRVFRDGLPILIRDRRLHEDVWVRTQLEHLDMAGFRRLWWNGFQRRWNKADTRGS